MQEYDIKHTITSPFHPQANGQAERMVQTVKHLLKKAKDPYIALLHYRNTQLDTGKSPAELFLGRKLKTTLPARTDTLKHEKKHSQKQHKTSDNTLKNKKTKKHTHTKKHYFDRKDGNKLSSFKPGDPVMMKFGDTWKKQKLSNLIQHPDHTLSEMSKIYSTEETEYCSDPHMFSQNQMTRPD